VSNDDLLQHEAGVNGGWRSDAGTDIRLTGRWTRHERGYPGPFGSNPAGAYEAVDRLSRGITTNRVAGLRLQQPLGGAGLSAAANYLRSDNEFESAFGLSASTTSRFETRVAANVDIWRAAALSVGGAYQDERATSTFIAGNGEELLPIDRRGFAGFGELRLQAHRSFSLTAGLRAEAIERQALQGSIDAFNPRPAFESRSDWAVNPRISAALWLPSQPGGLLSWSRIRFAAGTGMRSPDALEIAFTDNPDLQPERSRSVEAGIDGSWLGDRLMTGVTAFFNRYDDLIVAVGPAMRDASRFRTDNISNAAARGMEAFFGGRTAWGLAARFTYTFLHSEILASDGLGTAPPPFDPGDPLLRRPRHRAALEVTLTRGPVTLFGRASGRGRTLDVEPTFGTFGGLFINPGHEVVDAGISLHLARQFSVLARVANLLDSSYEESFGFPSPRRTAMIGVRLAAGR
jgi:outer membrane receptor protein involved in Fe transport